MNSGKLPGPAQEIIKRDQICQWVQQLSDPTTRGNALLELNKRREVIPDLGVSLWHSFGAVTALLQEIVDVYAHLNPLSFTATQSQRLCQVLNLLKSIASHPETKTAFAQAKMPNFIYPFLKLYKGEKFENVRKASLKVLDALVRNDSEEAVRQLLSTEVLLYVLEIIEKDTTTSKTLAVSVLQGVLATDDGLVTVCDTHERFSRVTTVLGDVVSHVTGWAESLQQKSSGDPAVLLRLVVQCFWKLSQNARGREALKSCLPLGLLDGTFAQLVAEDMSTNCMLTELLSNLGLCSYVFDMPMVD